MISFSLVSIVTLNTITMFLSAYLAKSATRGVTNRVNRGVTNSTVKSLTNSVTRGVTNNAGKGVTNSTAEGVTNAAVSEVSYEKFETLISQLKELEALRKQNRLLQFKISEEEEFGRRLKRAVEWLKTQK